MDTVNIGRGMCRTTVRSRAKRERLAMVAGIRVDEDRVIFPSWMLRSVERVVSGARRKRHPKPEQINLVDVIERKTANG